jgi:hypothetical protein
MFRSLILARRILSDRDRGSALFLVIILLVAVWLMGMLFTTAIPRATMNRFHLRTESFLAWSIQQLIPSMYNLENEFAFVPDGPVPDSVLSFSRTANLNHFPLRVVTFFDYRYGLFHAGNGGSLRVTSRYREQSLTTRWQVRRDRNQMFLEFEGSGQ